MITMTHEIQSRIDQIRRGEVPEGYKKTVVGIIPSEWKTTRFKKKFNRLTRKNTIGNTNVLTISAQLGLVNQEEFFNKTVASDDKSNYYLLNQGEYAYNKSYSNGYPFGAIKRLDKYKQGVVSPLYICFSASDENKCPEFYLQYFEAGRINSEIKAFAQEGARNHGLLNISVDDFFNAILIEPPLSEQEKIAEILETQDRVIELCEKKVEQLKKLKKAMMQKMFPKKGENVPEIRFPGFTDPWEQRKLGDEATEIIAGGDIDKELLCEKGNYPVIANALTGDGIVGYYKEQYRIKAPAVTVTGRGDVGHAKARNIDFTPVVRLLSIKSNHNPLFLENAINTLQIVIESTGVPQLTVPQLAKYELMFPKALEEETQIGNFFASLDNLITLHQRKCDDEQQKKKALMQLLLTGIVRI